MFTKCGNCRKKWLTRTDFIDDKDIQIIGYQANFEELKAGLLFFNHSCKSTLALPADRFTELYSGPIFEEQKNGTDGCPGYCLNKDDLRPCQIECECAYIREIIQLFKGAENVKIV